MQISSQRRCVEADCTTILLAPLLATRMSPLELVEAVESDDAQAIAEAVEIASERATNVIAHLQPRNLTEIIAAPVDDAVELSLLDGVDYKESDNLSIGATLHRCFACSPQWPRRAADHRSARGSPRQRVHH